MKNPKDYIVRFYKYLDRPMLIFIIELDDLIIGFLIFALQMITCMLLNVVIGGFMFVFLIVSCLSVYFWRKYKKVKPNGYIFQLLYRVGLLHPTSLFKQKSMRKKSKFKIVPLSITKKMYGQ